MLSAAGWTKTQLQISQQRLQGRPLLGLNGPLLQQPGHTAVHGTGVEVGEPQLASHLTGHRALTGTGWTIDGKDWQTAHENAVIDQAGLAAADSSRQQRRSCELLQHLQPRQVHQLQIVHSQAAIFHQGAHGLKQRLGLPLAGSQQLLPQRQRLRQHRGLLTLLGAEVGIARAQWQPIALAQGGAGNDLHRPIQITHQAAQHLELLPILFTEMQVAGLHQSQQAAHHGAHPFEMAWAAGTAKIHHQLGRRG